MVEKSKRVGKLDLLSHSGISCNAEQLARPGAGKGSMHVVQLAVCLLACKTAVGAPSHARRLAVRCVRADGKGVPTLEMNAPLVRTAR